MSGTALSFTDDAKRVFWAIATTSDGSVGYLMGRLAWGERRVRETLRDLEMVGAIERWHDPEISARAIYYRPVYAVKVPQLPR
mgnify:CR=1 FL=1